MTKLGKENSLSRNVIGALKKIVIYDRWTIRVVFEYEGDEIVLINESLIGWVRVYLNGSLAYSGWDWFSTSCNGWFPHKGKTYRVKATWAELPKFSQSFTFSINDEAMATKTKHLFANAKPRYIAYALFSFAVCGFCIAAVFRAIGM